MLLEIFIIPPEKAIADPNYAIIIHIEKKLLTTLQDDEHYDKIEIQKDDDDIITYSVDKDNLKMSHIFSNFEDLQISLLRKITNADLDVNKNMDMMPGLRVTWYWKPKIAPFDIFFNNSETRQFRR